MSGHVGTSVAETGVYKCDKFAWLTSWSAFIHRLCREDIYVDVLIAQIGQQFIMARDRSDSIHVSRYKTKRLLKASNHVISKENVTFVDKPPRTSTAMTCGYFTYCYCSPHFLDVSMVRIYSDRISTGSPPTRLSE